MYFDLEKLLSTNFENFLRKQLTIKNFQLIKKHFKKRIVEKLNKNYKKNFNKSVIFCFSLI